MAADLSRQIGKQSVEIKTQSGAVRYDLTGATHKGTPTPHVQTKTYNTNPKTGETFLNKVSGPAREATKQDIRTARKFLETKIFDVE
jgi:hypothetical protein